MYDYLIVGSGLFGAVCAHELTAKGKKCLVIDRRGHIGGNVYTENVEGINVHVYGAHIFHTSDKKVWDYINGFAEFNNFVNSPIAVYKDELYNLPFNMNTFSKLWGIKTPAEAMKKISEERERESVENPSNLEEQAINLVGRTIYEKLVKGYTAKQWGRPCSELPAFIIKRLPVRFTYDNNYFSDRYQGIPVGGYTAIIEKLLKGSDVRLGCDFFKHRKELEKMAERIIYTGQIDAFFDYKFGALEYRSLRFETEILNCTNYQGNAVINYTDYEVPYTRIIEHRHFEGRDCTSDKTVVTREYPCSDKGAEPYYPVNDAVNEALCAKYVAEAEKLKNVYFGGRLGRYKYYDMDKVIAEALRLCEKL